MIVLKPYQLEDLARLSLLDGAVLAWGCGLGKTPAMFIWAMMKCGWSSFGNEANVLSPVLIISPEDLHKQTAEDGLKFFGIQVQPMPRQFDRIAPGFYICSYTRLSEEIPPDAFACVVVDEGDKSKKTSSDAGRMVRRLKPRYRLIATATPMADRLPDLFWLCSWVCENDPPDARRFPYAPTSSELADFSARFICQTEGSRNTSAEVSQLLLLWRWLSAIILRRRMDDTGETVVGMEHRIIPCPLSRSQHDEYGRVLRQPGLDIGIRLGALRRIAGGAAWPNPKLATAVELIGNVIGRRQQVLVASEFRGPNDSLSALLHESGIPHVLMDGRTAPAVRSEMADRFKAGAVPVTLIGLKSGAEGLSYPRCNNVILLNYSWEQKKLPQVIHRARRINSERDLEVWSLVCEGTIETRMVELVIGEKGSAADLVLDGIWPSSETSDDLDWLSIACSTFGSDHRVVEDSELIDQWPGLKARLQAIWHSTFERSSNYPPSQPSPKPRLQPA